MIIISAIVFLVLFLGLETHSVDTRQLLGQLQHDSDEEGLTIERRAEKLQDCHFLLSHHLPALLLHLLHVRAHVMGASELLQN